MDHSPAGRAIVIVGVGEIGGVFALSFLRCGYPVYPVNRGTVLSGFSTAVPDLELVLVSVGENDLQPVLSTLPACWRDKVVLIQNELLPRDWESYDLIEPTIVSVWFEKKKGQEVKVVVPSQVFGPHGRLLETALAAADIPAVVVPHPDDMLFELIRKNLYILVTNICGLKTGGTVGELWSRHEEFARDVAQDVLDLQCKLVGRELDREKLIIAMLVAFNGDSGHKCMGRTARLRLQRAIEHGDSYQLELPVLREVLKGCQRPV